MNIFDLLKDHWQGLLFVPEMMAAVEGVLSCGNFKGLGTQQIARTRTPRYINPHFRCWAKLRESWGTDAQTRGWPVSSGKWDVRKWFLSSRVLAPNTHSLLIKRRVY